MTQRFAWERYPRLPEVLIAITAVLVVLGAAIYVLGGSGSQRSPDSAAVDALQSIALDASAAGSGDAAAIAAVERQAAELRRLSRGSAAEQLASDARFTRLLQNAESLVKARGPLADAAVASRQAHEIVPRMLGEISGITGGLAGATLEPLVRPVERFELAAQRLLADVDALVSGSNGPSQAAQRLAESSEYMGQVIRGLQGTDGTLGLPRLTGAETERRLKSLEGQYAELQAAVRKAVGAAPGLPAAQAASRALAGDARALASVSLPPSSAIPGGRTLLPALVAIPALLLLAALWLFLKNLREAGEQQKIAALQQRQENERNQRAILRLLDELSTLANGDLTVQATVTEDITGAIADSINYAVEALRGLVVTINHSAIQLDGAARQTQALAQHLAKASGAQSKQIVAATESVGEMAGSTEEVSGNAERAADVARHSVDVAHKGGEAVRRTIDGMNAIRETIQETSKRIKRLGESSQEIGNIVELINDIAEQTNILALNASIQASMAGEAGRGFAVVADEVQRLAERAANATKQIEVLVRTIQTDTNEAVVSMERSTTDVVGGALLAENAGAALEEIEKVSNQIASLVQNISGSSRQQAGAAQSISRNMQVLREISAQTAEATSATSASIAKLAELSAGLRKSAAGFRLPAPADAPGATGTQRRLEEARPVVRPISAAGG